MTPDALTRRAAAYVAQALERLNAVEAQGGVAATAGGEWVSLRRNLESARDDLAPLLAALPPLPGPPDVAPPG